MKFIPLALTVSLLTAIPAVAEVNAFVERGGGFFSGQGQLESTDDVYEYEGGNYYYDTWHIYGEAGDQLRISAESSDFDSMIIVLSVGESGVGLVGVNDDLSSETTNSQIDVVVNRSGNFVIAVLPYNPLEQGAYTVGVQAIGAAPSSTPRLSSEQRLGLDRIEQQALELNRVLGEINSYPLF